MKKLPLIALVASGSALVPVPRSDAGVGVGVEPVGVTTCYLIAIGFVDSMTSWSNRGSSRNESQ
jgi:hypothetical protein